LREKVIRLDHHLDAGNKDSVIGGISNWIAEIGELESSLKRDIGKLKGFLTLDCDKLRRPYGRGEIEYPRRTVFAATVNDYNFLIDPTGNNRWWTIAVDKLDFQHGIDMQQLFAQLAIDVRDGIKWVLTPEEEHQLNTYNLGHRSVSAVRERILDAFDLEAQGDVSRKSKTAIEVLVEAGFNHPNNMQCKEAAAVLREYLGNSKRIHGKPRWHVPVIRTTGYEFDRKFNSAPEADEY
jgi:predicted P-loop ATPase